ncbi:type II toxin-antitoxin system HipA family toxin [Nitratireductor sp.]|uniref:type II toxin-antitoxin system HipA family toxin n=1 Tax=Nitratireductor sp. TaxID=1872084 RepID=UPI002603340A|nr:type II toxin-antitoxin system HipA family toxin [Nitratireductor sp.]MCV0381720.1 type II toxin-antitoxin system HipA family toxin [Nitratireductor sp.]
MSELIVLLSEREIGRVQQDQRGRLKFTYTDAWRETRGAYPLSLSMPLAASEHSHDAIDAFIWGLLPDNQLVIERWAKKFQVSARSSFGLISHVGEDCAGAVQFVRPERLDAVLDAGPGDIAWLTDQEVAARLKTLRDDHAAWRRPGDTGQFSLAGAQPKTALLLQNGKWGVPSGRVPTTHIIKPPTGDFDGHAENEHFCLALARALGLPAASSTVTQFDDEVAFVVERYDRRVTERGILRIHQEDMCQALGVPPTMKYENEGGPSVSRIVDLLRENSSVPRDDAETFIDAIAFNWLVGGTDAHAKNYSILIGTGGRVRLAPLYDVASILPYEQFDPMKIRLAMKLGGKYRIRDISARSWDKLSDELRLNKDEVAQRVCNMASRIPDQSENIRAQLKESGMNHPIVDRMAETLQAHAAKCERIFREFGASSGAAQ